MIGFLKSTFREGGQLPPFGLFDCFEDNMSTFRLKDRHISEAAAKGLAVAMSRL